MATHKVRDPKGTEFEVHSKEQADQWVAVGYTLVGDKSTTKPAAKKSAPAKK